MMRPCERVAAPLIALALIATGCGERRDILARVGDEIIAAQDLLQAVRGGAGERYAGDPAEAKALLLDDLVRRKLMILEARKLSAVNQDILDAFRARVEHEVLSAALIERMAPSEVRVSEIEVRQLYAWRDSSAHIQVIFHPERAVARFARDEITRGARFEDLANRHNPSGLLPPGGDFGFLTAGALVDPLDRLLREAPVGQIIGPIEAPGEGWFVVRIVERRGRELEPYEAVATPLREMLRQRKRRSATSSAFERLRTAYRLTIEPGAAQILYARFNRPADGSLGAGTQAGDERLDRVLARYDAGPKERGTLTVLDALNDLESGASEIPDPSMTVAFEQWIETRAMDRIVVLEARRQRLQDEPEVARRIAERYDNKLVDDIYHVEVEEKASGSDADISAAMAELGLGATAYQALDAEDQNRVLQSASRRAQERRFDQFIDSLRERYPVRTNPERLAAVPWPPRAGTQQENSPAAGD